MTVNHKINHRDFHMIGIVTTMAHSIRKHTEHQPTARKTRIAHCSSQTIA
jgi:hypothetical protein